MWMTETCAEDLGGFEKSQLVELNSWLGRRRLTFACSPRPCGGCRTWWEGDRWKSQNRKNVHLSPYVEEPLDSKVIKSFVPELRSRKRFSCFGNPMFYVFSQFRIWLWYRYPAWTMTDADNADDIALLTDTFQLHSQEKAAEDIRFYVNADKTECICFNREEMTVRWN